MNRKNDKQKLSKRMLVRLKAEDWERLDEQHQRTGKKPGTIARNLILQGLPPPGGASAEVNQ